MDEKLQTELIETYFDAPVEGSKSRKWVDEGKEAYQDGLLQH